MLAIIEAKSLGLLYLKNWLPNLFAGFIVSVIALPALMACAIAVGVKPEQGIYTAIVGGITIGLFGGSRVQIAGPTSALIAILADSLASNGVIGLQVTIIMAGILLVFLGWIKMGNFLRFIPNSVVVGIISAIGIIIILNQWKAFFGLAVQLPAHSSTLTKLFILAPATTQLSFIATTMGFLCLLCIFISRKFFKSVPAGYFLTVLIATILQIIFAWDIPTLGSVYGHISQKLPNFQIPIFNIPLITESIVPAATLACIIAFESLLSAKIADNLTNTKHDSNQELIGHGLANLFSSLFGGIALSGTIVGTVTNIRAGGNSPIASIAYALFLLIFLTLLIPFTANIPFAVLAATLFAFAYHMIDLQYIKQKIKLKDSNEIFIILLTFSLTLFVNLISAIVFGLLIAKLLSFSKIRTNLFTERK